MLRDMGMAASSIDVGCECRELRELEIQDHNDNKRNPA